jgi:hypothetical protein
VRDGRTGVRDPWLWAALLVGASLRFAWLGAPSLWLDEALSARTASLPAGAILDAAARDLHPPGYYLLLHLWVLPWPPAASGWAAEWALRSLSACASVGALPVVYVLGLAWAAGGRGAETTARWAIWLAAVSPFDVALAREARPYALLACLVAVQWSLWTRLRRGGGGAPGWIGMGAALAAGLWLHYLAGLFWLGLTAAGCLDGERRGPFLRRWAWTSAAAGVTLLPWLPVLLAQLGTGPRSWLAFHHSPLILLRTAAGFFRGATAGADELAAWAIPVTILLAAGARRRGLPAAALVAVPMVVVYTASFALPLWDPRYLGGAAVAAWVLAARGLLHLEERARDRRAGRAAAALCVAAEMIGLPAARSQREGWRGLVREAATCRDGPVIFPFVEPFAPFTFYAAGAEISTLAAMRPAATGLALDPGLADRLAGTREACLVVYLEDVYDPARQVRAALVAAGLTDVGPSFRSGRLELRRFVRPKGPVSVRRPAPSAGRAEAPPPRRLPSDQNFQPMSSRQFVKSSVPA